MPEIRLDIFAYLHQAQLRRTEMEAKNRFEKLGQQAGDDLTKGIENAAPKIRRAMNSAADSASDYARRTNDLKRAQQEHNDAVEKAIRLERDMEAQRARTVRLTETSANLERNLGTARREARDLLRDQTSQEGELDAIRLRHSATLREIHQLEEKLADTRADGGNTTAIEDRLAESRRRSKRETDDIRDAEWVLGQTRGDVGQKTDEVSTFEKELSEIRKEHSGTVNDLDSNEKELAKTRERAAKTDEDIIKRNDDVERSHRRREESLRRLVETENDDGGGRGGGFGGIGGRGNGYGRGRGPLAGILPGGARASAGVYAAAAPLAGDLAMGLVTASQSLAILPAVAAAGAAGLLTLKLGFDGLGQAIKDVGDPKKFATDLQDIGPAAQQVALEIQYLTEGPLKDLKTALEESLFKGIPEKLHNLANTFLPPIQQLTTGVGDAFNNMFGNLAGQLTTPESLKSISEIINNIVTAFQKLEPAVAPFIDALTKITQSGSTFLPGFASSIADAAKSFDDFITKAQQSGALQEFMHKGVEAVKVFLDKLLILGEKIYEIFGNKSPEQFKQLLDDVVNAVITIGQVLEGAGKAANVLLQGLQGIANAVGGYQTLFELAFGVFIGAKFAGILGNVSKLAGLLGAGAAGEAGVGGALAAIPGLAGAASGSLALLGAAAAAAIGVSAYAIGQNWNSPAYAQNRPTFAGVPGAPGVPAAGQRVSGPGVPLGLPNLPVVPGAVPPGAAGNGNPLQAFNPAAPPGGGFDYRQWYPKASPPPAGAGLPPYSPFDVPPAPPGPAGPKESQTDKVRAAMSAMDPSQFMPSVPSGPIGMPGQPGGPGSPGPGNQPGPLAYGTGDKPYAKPGLGYWNVNDATVLSAKNRLDREAYDVGQARMQLQALKNIGVTVQEIRDAEEKVKEQEASYNEAYLALTKAQEGTWKKVAEDKQKSTKLDKLGPGLDADFGLGNGLAGFTDNLIRFAATMAMAPVLGGLSQMAEGDGGGFGLLGITGAQNIANGKSPLLGNDLPSDQFPQPAYPAQYPTQPYSPSGSYLPSGGSAGSTVAGGNPTIPQPNENAIRSWVQQNFGIPNTFGTGSWENASHSDDGAWHHTGFQGQKHVPSGYGFDFHGSTEQMDALANWIASNDAKDTLELIHQGPGFDHNREIKNGQFGDVYGAGTNAAHGDHVHWATTAPWLQGQGGVPDNGPLGSDPNSIAQSALGGPGLSSGVVPVFVTNMPGGGAFGGGGGPAIGSPTSGQGAGPQPGPGQGGLSPEQWQNIAGGPGLNESSGNWQANTGNGFSGGLQFTPSTWNGFGGQAYAPEAWQASPEEQMDIANKVFAKQGAGAWPGVSAAHPDWFKPQGSSPTLGGGPTFGAPGPPTVGGGQGPVLGGSNPSGSPVGRSSNQDGWMPAAGPGLGIGGMAGGALSAAAGAIPGLGQLAQTAMQGINRTISYAGQLGSIGVEGLMETFLPSGSELGDPQKSWFGRLAAGLAQAKPAVPTSAGKTDEKQQKEKQQQQDPNSPQQQGGPMVNIENFVQAPNRNGQQAAGDLAHRAAEQWTRKR